MKISKYLFLLFSLLSACASPVQDNCKISSDIKKNIARYISQSNWKRDEQNFLLLIPLGGCGYCKDFALDFAAKNIQSENLSVHISSQSKKVIKIKLEEFNLMEENVVIDRQNLSVRLSLAPNNPALIEYSEGRVCAYTLLNSNEIENKLAETNLKLNKP